MPRAKAASPQTDFLTDFMSHARRQRPVGPVITQIYPDRGVSCPPVAFETRRYTLSAIWSPPASRIGFVTLYQAHTGSETFKRLQRWAYLNRYGAMVIGNLFPVCAWEQSDYRAQPGTAMIDDVLAGARAFARAMRALQAQRVVLAFGDLRPSDDLVAAQWMADCCATYSAITFKCFGHTEKGWPLAPAISGKTPVELDGLKLKRWTGRLSPKQRQLSYMKRYAAAALKKEATNVTPAVEAGCPA